MVSSTPSGGWLQSSPVIPGLGFPLGNRGQMFSLTAGHPNVIAPGKRPRTTLTPSLALRDGRPFMAFGSPGGDNQDQWALLFLLNVVEFGMSLQEAVEAPTFWTTHAPCSFYPRRAEPGVLHVEGRIDQAVRDDLAARGHIVKTAADWGGGNTLAARWTRIRASWPPPPLPATSPRTRRDGGCVGQPPSAANLLKTRAAGPNDASFMEVTPVQPTETLKHEHQVILMVLQAAEREAESIAKTGQVRADDVERMVDFFLQLRRSSPSCEGGEEPLSPRGAPRPAAPGRAHRRHAA